MPLAGLGRMKWLVCALLLSALLPAATWARDVRVAFATTLEPFVIPQRNSGIEVEIVRTVLQRLGHRLVPVYLPTARMTLAFAQKQVDAVATSLPLGDRGGFYSEPYVVFENVAVTLASRKIKLATVSDLAGLKVVAFQKASQSLGEAYLQAVRSRADYREISDHMGQNRLLYLGGTDVIVIEKHVFEYQNRLLYSAKFPEKPQQVDIHHLFAATEYRMRFHDEALRDEFDLELALVKQLGIPEAILRKYQR